MMLILYIWFGGMALFYLIRHTFMYLTEIPATLDVWLFAAALSLWVLFNCVARVIYWNDFNER